METPEQWPRIKEIVGAALEREAGERCAFLDEACSQNAELRAEVDSLLLAYEDAEELSEHPWGDQPADSAGESKTIGPYRLIKELGVGGMGQVWLAVQTEPVRRRIALKLIKAGMYDAAVVQRFQSERQSLAIMDHPAIAKVFDAGATSSGRPYFAMEYVDGLAITDYCDRKKLEIRERLKLFIQVCEGVQHAHQKAIIHRDLKPSNILVVEVDGKPRPRIIDFGLAKAVAPVAPGETLFTQAGAFLGTPGYMSPEQADPDLHDIDTRTDVYSLGVVLYELLTGFLPFDPAQWKKQRLDAVLRQLREEDPQRPSAKISANRDTSTDRAEARRTEPRRLATSLREDLDSITMKALEKERDRRYNTPLDLAADIDLYLQNRPVEARPASATYRLRKYARRHFVGVAVASGVAALLITFAVMQAMQLRRITRERDRADRITQFMTRMFVVSDPSEARGNSITAREILDKSSKEVDTGLAKDPELQARMLHVIGTVYESLGLYARAESLVKRAVDIRRRVLGPYHPETLTSEAPLGLILHQEGRYAEAEKLDRELLGVERRVLGPEHRATLATMSNLFWTLDYAGHPAEAEKLGRETLEAQQRVFGNDDSDTLQSMRRLASVLGSADHNAEAEALTRRNLEIRKRLLGPTHADTLLTMSDLGLILVNEGRNAEAETLLRETLEIQRRVLGAEHQNTIATMNSLGIALQHEGHLPEAEKLYRKAFEASRRALGAEHRGTLLMLGNLATIINDQGHYPEAEKLQRELLAVRRRTLGPDHPDTALSIYNVAEAVRRQGRYAEAATLFRETADIQRRVLGPNHSDTVDSMYNLACVLALDHKRDEALSTLREAVEHGVWSDQTVNIETDTDLNTLHGDPQFAAIVADAKKRAAAATRKPN